MDFHDSESDFYILMIIPLTFNSFNFLGTLYIFYRTFIRWLDDHRSISLSYKFPFYVAITDFLYSSAILINFSYSATNKSKYINNEVITWPSPFCEILGYFTIFFIFLNMLLVGSISITTWLRVVKEYYFELGNYDYKIWFPVILMSSIFALSAEHAYGSQVFWCATKPGYNFIGILFFIIIILTFSIIVFCYVHVLKTIHDIKENIPNSHNDLVQRAIVERKSLQKVLTYIFVFIMQYIPILIYNVFRLLKMHYVALDALGPSAISFGGIGNVIQYICNEELERPSSNITSLECRPETDEQQSNNISNLS